MSALGPEKAKPGQETLVSWPAGPVGMVKRNPHTPSKSNVMTLVQHL